MRAFADLRLAIKQPLWPGLSPDFDLTLPYFHVLTYELDLDTIEAICLRIKVRRRTLTDLAQIQEIRQSIKMLSEKSPRSEIAALLSNSNDRILLALWAANPDETTRTVIINYATDWRHVRPATDGKALIELGLKPGPQIGQVLQNLRNAWLDGKITSHEEEAALLQDYLETDHTGDND